jgi:hypothetical protein
MKPICVRCQRFYRPKQNGFRFTEGMPGYSDNPNNWRPYKLWVGDLWECKGCGHEVIVGVGLNPVSEHYMPNFEKVRTDGGFDRLQVNDC